MPVKKSRTPAKKTRRYGKAASTKVEAAMKERKRGTLRSGRARQEGHQPQAGRRDRPVAGAPRRRQGAKKRKSA